MDKPSKRQDQNQRREKVHKTTSIAQEAPTIFQGDLFVLHLRRVGAALSDLPQDAVHREEGNTTYMRILMVFKTRKLAEILTERSLIIFEG